MRGSIVLGVTLAVMGVAWILDLNGVTIFPGGFSTWWPLIVVLAGLVTLVSAPWRWPGALALTLVGGALLAWRLGYLPALTWAYVGAVALIALGVLLATKPFRRRRWEARWQRHWHHGWRDEEA